MVFADPLFALLGLLAVPLLALSFRRRGGSVALPSASGLAAVRPTLRLRIARALPILRAAAVVLLAIAIARPHIGDASAVVPGEGIDIALSLDLSSSMTTTMTGTQKTRLEVSKDVLREFVSKRENDRVGLVVFQRDALALSPPTLDYRALDTMIADLKSGLLADGTGIGAGLGEGLNMLRDSTAASRVVILLTDGQHNAPNISPEDASELAAALHIKVYTVGVVSKVAPLGQPNGEIDEVTLKAIADRTGGRYFVTDTPTGLADIYSEIGQLETSGVGREHFEQFTEIAPWFLGGAAALIALDLLLGATWLRRAPA